MKLKGGGVLGVGVYLPMCESVGMYFLNPKERGLYRVRAQLARQKFRHIVKTCTLFLPYKGCISC